jgi:cellulose synthase/poly-beta-1,6-N-acetylglucosamine synthase-like glycosyltransferase
LRLHQEGRAALGWDATLYGSHGYALSRAALARLGWRTTTGHIAEDMELRLRCTLAGIPVQYAPSFHVLNDVTADAAEVHEQRRRWNSTYLPLIPDYVGPLARQGLQGSKKAWDTLFGLLLLPSFANLFFYITGLLCLTLGLAYWHGLFGGLAGIAFGLWLADIAYFLFAFHRLGVPLRARELRGFLLHIGIRFIALLESLFYVHIKVWRPAHHERD